ncbi:glycosyl transferase group 1 [Caldicellulosiruptor hydrothermalis 108]|uniref:Glycosyl transferase group 1 n=1 Tax=Caldicellulosiruptor hydrothermalis (strain DSM 18901 / VKM B-2411 / 108) TaxID=632292 RepID=E4Q8G6_CALH1|nr:glycosyltransferase [Caldicellulosiruptor hydrothermalis]ADQ06811.1 glycosyl transferase group 1 [Caldicellulosiruptor hydrothermalis 108]
MNENIESKVERIKKLLNELVEKGELDYALEVINKCENVIKNDAEIISIKGIIYYAKNEIEKAEEVFKKGLLVDSTYADFYYNLGCVYELKEEYEKAAKFFARSLEFATGEETIEIGKKLNNILCKISTPLKDETKIAFFVKPGLDSFLNDIILGLMDEYFVRKITVTDFKQIDEGMQWADICWFEWCDDLVIYGSRHELAREKKLVCRIHRYEAFTNYIFQVEWENIDKVIFVASHIFDIVNSKLSGNIENKSIIIPNGIRMEDYNFRKREKGFNVAYVGYLNYRKSPNMLLQIINKLKRIDKRYRLFIAGEFQDEENMMYFKYMLKEMSLEEHVIFDGWQKDINAWLEDKDYLVSCSISEGHPVGIMEAMVKGIKPVIHNFVGARDIYPEKYLWNTIDEAVDMILDRNYDSIEYREFISNNYSLKKEIDEIKKAIVNLGGLPKKNRKMNVIDLIHKVNSLVRDNYSVNNEFTELLTIVTPTYNRSNILKEDLENNLKMGKIKKIIVENGSEPNHVAVVKSFDLDKYGIQKIIYLNKNIGPNEGFKIGLDQVETEFFTSLPDDDIILVKNSSKKLDELLREIRDENVFLCCRYVVKLMEDKGPTAFYDRSKYNNLYGKDFLTNMLKTGEIEMFGNGAILHTYEMKHFLENYLPEPIFYACGDYVFLARLFGHKPEKKIIITDKYIYLQRYGKYNTSSLYTMKEQKLYSHLISMLIASYYCLKNSLLSKDEIVDSLLKRAQLLKNLYGLEIGFTNMMVNYIFEKKNVEQFIEIIKDIYNLDMGENIPPEIIEIVNCI